MSTNTDSREVSRAFGRRQCRTCDGGGYRRIPIPNQVFRDSEGTAFGSMTGCARLEPCPECAERDAEARRLDQCQRAYSRNMLIAALVPLTLAGLALAWVMWRMLSGRWAL